MPFDIEGARKAGWSDKDIFNELASSTGFDIEGARKAGYDDNAIMSEMALGGASTQTKPKPKPNSYGVDIATENIPKWAQKNPRLAGVGYAAKTVFNPLMEALGLIGGGIGGATIGGPIGGVGGAGLGYAAAKGIERPINRAFDTSLQPNTPMKELAQQGKDVISGGAMEMGGQVAGRAVKSVVDYFAAPFSKTIEPFGEKALRIARQYGVDLMPTSINKSKPLSLTENVLGFIPGSSGIIQKARLNELNGLIKMREEGINKIAEGKAIPESIENVGYKIQEKLGKYIDSLGSISKKESQHIQEKILKQLGSSDSYESLGLKTQEILSKKSAEAVAKKNSLYREAMDALPEGDYDTKTLVSTGQKYLSELAESPNANPTVMKYLKWATKTEDNPEIARIMDSIKEYPPNVQKSILAEQGIDPSKLSQPIQHTAKGLQQVRTELSDLIQREDKGLITGNPNLRGQLSNEGRIYKDIQKAIDADIQTISKGTNAESKLNVANAFYGDEYAPVWKNKDILRQAKADPESLVKSILRPGNVSEIELTKKAVGDIGFEPLKRKWVNSIFDDAVKGGEFEWGKVLKSVENMEKSETLNHILKPQEIISLKSAIEKGIKGESINIDPWLSRVFKAAKPDVVMNLVFTPNNAKNIGKLRTIIDKETFSEAKTMFTKKLLQESEMGLYRPHMGAKNISKFDEPTLKAIYKPEELIFLKNIKQISEATTSAEKLAGNPSGTAQSVITFQAGRALLTDPKTGAWYWFMPQALAKLYLSPIGRRYVTTGLNTPVNAGLGTNLASKIVSLVGADGLQPVNNKTGGQ